MAKEKLTFSRGDAVLNPNRKQAKGLSRGQMDKLARKYERYVEQGVPRNLWDNDLLAYEAYEVYGMACPSSPVAQTMYVPGGKKPESEAEN